MSSNFNFVRGANGQVSKKTVLPSQKPSIANVAAVGKSQIDLENIVVNGQTISIEPESITYLNVTTPGVAEANKALLLNDDRDIENINQLTTNELYVGGSQVTGLVNRGATVSDSEYLNNIQPGFAKNNKIISSNDNGEIENVNMASESVEYNGGIVDGDLTANTPDLHSNIYNDYGSDVYSHLKLESVSNYTYVVSSASYYYDKIGDLYMYSSVTGALTLVLFENFTSATGGAFSKSINIAASTVTNFSTYAISYNSTTGKYLIPTFISNKYTIYISPSGHPSTWTNSSVWTTVDVATTTGLVDGVPMIRWSSLLNKYITAIDGKVYQSDTGETWSLLYTISASYLGEYSIVCHTTFVAVFVSGNSSIYFTTNGTTWNTKTFTSSTLPPYNYAYYLPEVDCICTGTLNIRLSTFLSRSATGNSFDSILPGFITGLSYRSRYYPVVIQNPVAGSQPSAYIIFNTGLGYLTMSQTHILYDVDRKFLTRGAGCYFDGKVNLLAYNAANTFANSKNLRYSVVFRDSQLSLKPAVYVEPEVFLNFEPCSKAIIKDFQWVPDINKYLAIGFANEGYSTANETNVCLYHSDDLQTFKFIRDLGITTANKIVVEETTGYVYCVSMDTAVNVISLKDYGNTYVTSINMSAVRHAFYDKYYGISVFGGTGGVRILFNGHVFTATSYTIGSFRGKLASYSNGSSGSSPVVQGVPVDFLTNTAISSTGGEANSSFTTNNYRIKLSSAGSNTIFNFTGVANYTDPIFIEELNIFVRILGDASWNSTLRVSYTPASTITSTTEWIDIPLSSVYFNKQNNYHTGLKYDPNSGRLYIVSNSDLMRTSISLKNVSLETVPFMKSTLSSYYSRDDSGEELYPFQIINNTAVNFNSITYSLGRYLLCSSNKIHYGSRLHNLSSIDLEGSWNSIASSLSRIVVVGNGKISSSLISNGSPLSFSAIASTGTETVDWRCVEFSDQLNVWTACGNGKWGLSLDGMNWEYIDCVGSWVNIKYSNGHWIAVGLNKISYLKMTDRPADFTTAAIQSVTLTGDWKDISFCGRWMITGAGKTMASRKYNNLSEWDVITELNGKNFNSIVFVEGLNQFILQGEHFASYVVSLNKVFIPSGLLISEMANKTCKEMMWSERYKSIISIGNNFIAGSSILASGLDSSLFVGNLRSSSLSTVTSFLKVLDYSNTLNESEGYLSATSSMLNTDIVSFRNNTTMETSYLALENNNLFRLKVPNTLHLSSRNVKVLGSFLLKSFNFNSINVKNPGQAASNKFLSLDNNGSVNSITNVTCGGLIIGDEMYSSTVPISMSGVMGGAVSARKAIKLNSSKSLEGVETLNAESLTFGSKTYKCDGVEKALAKWGSVLSNPQGGTYHINDMCYSAFLDLYIAVPSFNGVSDMNSEREKNYILISKDGINWIKSYTGLRAFIRFVVPAEEFTTQNRTGVFFFTSTNSLSSVYNGIAASMIYSPDCSKFYYFYADGFNFSSGPTSTSHKMFISNSVTNNFLFYEFNSNPRVVSMYSNGPATYNTMNINNVKNAITLDRSTFFGLANNNYFSVSSSTTTAITGTVVSSGVTINNCEFIKGLSGVDNNWDVVYVSDAGRVFYNTTSSATINMVQNAVVVVDATCTFNTICYNSAIRRILIGASNGKLYISAVGSKTSWTLVNNSKSGLFGMNWTRIRSCGSKGFLLTHEDDGSAKVNSKICRVDSDGVFLQGYQGLRRTYDLGAYGNGMYVIPINENSVWGDKIAYSRDGMRWDFSLYQTPAVVKVVFSSANNKFYALSVLNVLESTDAINWSVVYTHPISSAYGRDLIFAEDRNTIVALFSGITTKQLVFSSNFSTWNESDIVCDSRDTLLFLGYSSSLQRLIISPSEGVVGNAVYTDNFTSFANCVSGESIADTLKPSGRNITWVRNGAFFTMFNNNRGGHWNSSDGITWTKSYGFIDHSTNSLRSVYTSSLCNCVWIEEYGDLVIPADWSRGSNIVRISEGSYKVIAPVESNSTTSDYNLLIYNRDRNQLLAYKSSEGQRKGDIFQVIDLEESKLKVSREIDIDVIDSSYADKKPVTDYINADNTITLANSKLDGGALNVASLATDTGVLKPLTNYLDSFSFTDLLWVSELELLFACTNSGIFRSPDGIKWIGCNNFVATSISWSPQIDKIVAVRRNNAGGCVTYSSNGIDWTVTNSTNDLMNWDKVLWASGMGLFVCCSSTTGTVASGTNNKFMTSADGVNWTNRASAQDTIGYIYMAYSPDLNMISGMSSTNTITFSSIDGINFVNNTTTSYTGTLRDMIWSSKYKCFILLSNLSSYNYIYVSGDGLSYANSYTTLGGDSFSICWSPYLETFALSGSTSYHIATTGYINTRVNTYIDTAAPNSTTAVSKVEWCDKFKCFFLVNSQGTNRVKRLIENKTLSYPGHDLINSSAWRNVCWSPSLNLFVATAESGIDNFMVSSDGLNWKRANNYFLGLDIRGICWSPELSMFIAVSRTGGRRVLKSLNGVDWSLEKSAGWNLIKNDGEWTKVCWSSEKNLFVAVADNGTNRIMTSADGVNWIYPSSVVNNTAMNSLAFSDIIWSAEAGLFIATTTASAIYSTVKSVDGINWYLSYIANYAFTSVAWSSQLSVFIASASNGELYISKTGEGWTSTHVPSVSLINSRIIWTGFKFVLSGNDTSNRGYILESKDGIIWEESFYVSSAINFSAIAYSPSLNTYAVVSNAGSNRATSIINSNVNALRTNSSYKVSVDTVLSYSPSITTSNWRDITYFLPLSKLFACTESGSGTQRIMSSTNYGASWTTENTVSSGSWTNITSAVFPANWKIMAVNSGSTGSEGIVNSGSGSWANNSTGGFVTSVCASEDLRLYVNVKNSGAMRVSTSTDGGSWTARSSADDTSSWSCVVWCGALGMFVALADAGTTRAMTSVNGIDWVARTLTGGLETVAWKKMCWSEKFKCLVAVAVTGTYKMMKSTDGINWTPVIPSDSNIFSGGIRNIVWCGGAGGVGVFLCISESNNERLIYSRNMVDWLPICATNSATDWTSICWLPDRNIAVAVSNASPSPSRTMNITFKPIPFSSMKLSPMPNNTEESTAAWSSVTWSQELNKFIAVASSGTNRIYQSANGSSWTLPTTVPAEMNSTTWRSVCWSPGLSLFVAIASAGTNRVATSPDGDVWTVVVDTVANARAWESVCWSPLLSMLVAVASSGTGRIAYSSNGSTWTSVTPPGDTTNAYKTVCWSPYLQCFVALSNTGTNRIIRSTNGTSWTAITSAIADASAWNSLCWSEELRRFVAVSTSGSAYVMISNDGINWENNTTSNTIYCSSVCWSSEVSMFVAVSIGSTNRLMYSNNGIEWVITTSGDNSNSWISICWAASLNKFVSVASAGIGRVFNIIVDRNNITPLYPSYGPIVNFVAPRENITQSYTVNKPELYTINQQFTAAHSGTIYNSGGGRVTFIKELKTFFSATGDGINYSYDGKTWYHNRAATNYGTRSIEYFNSNYVIGCGSMIRYANVLHDTYGATYTQVASGSGFFDGFAKKPGVILSYDGYKIVRSTNGYNWTDVGNYPCNCIKYVESLDKFVYTGTGGIFTSTDGLTWTNVSNFVGIHGEWSPKLNMFVLISASSMCYSYDLITWTVNPSVNYADMYRIIWNEAEELFMMSMYESYKFYISSNGIDWNYYTVTNYSSGYWYQMAYGNGIVIGSNLTGTTEISNRQILRTSTNVLYSLDSNAWSSVCRSDDKDLFVAVANTGTNRVAVSTTGVIWNQYASAGETDTWEYVVYCKNIGIFAAVSLTNKIMTSADGMNWTIATTPAFTSITSLCANNDRIILIYSTGSLTTTDGINWTSNSGGAMYGVVWSSLHNKFLGYNGTYLYQSANGITWTSVMTVGSGASNISNLVVDDNCVGVFILNTSFYRFSYDLTKWYAANINIYNSNVDFTVSASTWNKAIKKVIVVSKVSAGIRLYHGQLNGAWTSLATGADTNTWNSICSSESRRVSVAVALAGTSRVLVHDIPLSVYTDTNFSLDEGVSWRSVCWSEELGLYVAGGDNMIARSSNGILWQLSSTLAGSWVDICWSPSLNLFAAVASTNSNAVATSPDGINWTLQSAGGPVFTSIVWATSLGLFIAVGHSGTNHVATSPDGINWTQRFTYSNTNTWRHLCWSNELGIAVAVSDTGTNRVMTSVDGITWTARASSGETNGWFAVTWSSDLRLFVSVANTGSNRVMTSINGTTWTARTSATEANGWSSVIWSNAMSRFIATSTTGTNRIMSSLNGITWSTFTPTTSLDSHAVSRMVYSPSKRSIMAVCSSGFKRIVIISPPYKETYSISYDSVTQTAVKRISTAETNTWKTVCWSPELGIFCALSTNGTTSRVAISKDGTSWTAVTTSGMLSSQWISICWSPLLKLFLATASGATTNNFAISTDGIRWRTYTTSNPSYAWSCYWCDDLKIFLAISAISIMTSYDGINWTSRTPANTTAYWGATAWSPSLQLFVCVASSGTGNRISWSKNGINWNSTATGSGNAWVSIAWSASLSMFVAVASSGAGRIAYSSDGMVWTLKVTEYDGLSFTGVAWADEIKCFVAVTASGEILESIDGIVWRLRSTQTSQAYQGLCWSPYNNKFIAVSSGSTNRFTEIPALQTPLTITAPITTDLQRAYGSIDINVSLPSRLPTSNTARTAYSSSLNRYVSISSDGSYKLLYSNNGIDWMWNTANSVFNSSAWTSICWNGDLNLFIAVATSGTVRLITSSDGITWSAPSVPAEVNTNVWSKVITREYVENVTTNLILSVSNSGSVLRSVDGVSWTVAASGITGSEGFLAGEWSKELNRFIFIRYSTTTNTVLYSSDGLTWNTSTTTVYYCGDVVWCNSLQLFVCVSIAGTIAIAKSSDGITWTSVTVPTAMTNAITGISWSRTKNLLVITTANQIVWMSKNISYFFPKTILTINNPKGIIWIEERDEFLINSTNGSVFSTVLNVSDIVTTELPFRVKWDLAWSKPLQTFIAMKKVNPTTADNQLMISSDGGSWSLDTSLTTINTVSRSSGYTSYTEIPQWDLVYTSRATTFIQTMGHNNTSEASIASTPVTCVFYSNALGVLLVGCANTNLLYMANPVRGGGYQTPAITATMPAILTVKEIALCKGNHIIISNDLRNKYLYSYDLGTWTEGTLPASGDWTFASRRVRGYDLDIVGVCGGVIARSANGITWSVSMNYNTLESNGSRNFTHVKYFEEFEAWIAVDSVKKTNAAVFSYDGITWNDLTFASAVSICDFSFSSYLDTFVFLLLNDSSTGDIITMTTYPVVPTAGNVMKKEVFNINYNGGLYTGSVTNSAFLANTLETMPLLSLGTDSAYKPSTSTWTINSDERLKENIQNMNIDECLQIIDELSLKYYKWKDEFINTAEIKDIHKLGFIAQEVEEVIPDAILSIGDVYGIQDLKSINQDRLVATLYGCIQALIQRYERLKEELEK